MVSFTRWYANIVKNLIPKTKIGIFMAFLSKEHNRTYIFGCFQEFGINFSLRSRFLGYEHEKCNFNKYMFLVRLNDGFWTEQN